MATETANDLRKEAEELGGASRSIASGLARKGESSSLSKEPEQDIENQDVHVEDQKEEELDEEAAKDEEKLEEAVQPELETDNEPKDEDDDDEQDEDEQDDDDDSDDDDQSDDKKKKHTDDKKPEDNQRRGNKDNAQRRVDSKRDVEVEQLKGKIQEYEQAESQREEQKIEDEIKALATELKSDPEGLKKVIKFAERLAVRKVEQILKERLPSKEVVDSIKSKAHVSQFDTAFASPLVQGYLTETYPRATATQLAQAKNLLQRVSKGSQNSLDYFLMKNKKDFDALLDPRRRRGLETSRRHGTDTQVENRDTGSARGVDDLDKKYRDDQSGSGLRRERAGEKTF